MNRPPHHSNLLKQTALHTALGLVLGGASLTTQAALTSQTVLVFTAGVYSCPYGGTYPTCMGGVINVASGSWFSMDVNGDSSTAYGEKTAVQNIGGVASTDGNHAGNGIGIYVTFDNTGNPIGSHPGTINGAENPQFDLWEFFGNTGLDYLTGPMTDLGTDGSGKHNIDMTGWTVTWSGIGKIPMGGDTANYGGDTTIGIMTCGTASCSQSSTFTLVHNAHVPLGDPSGFGGVAYGLRLEGVVASNSALPTTTTTAAPTTTTTTTTTTTAAPTTTTTTTTTTTVTVPPTTTTAAATTTTAAATTTTAAGTTTTAAGTTTTAAGTTTTAAGTTTTTTTTTAPGTTTTAAGTTTTAAPTTSTTTAAPTTTTTTTTAPATTTTTTLAPPAAGEASTIIPVQANEVRSEWRIGDGDVKIYTNCPDANDLTGTDNALAYLDPFANPGVIPGELLQEGIFTVRNQCGPVAEKMVRVVSAFGAGGSQDANNNGLGDALEPAGLADNQMPVNGPTSKLAESTPGTHLQMGETAFEAGNAGVGVSEQDIINSSGGGLGSDDGVSSSCIGGCFSFKITGVAVGGSVQITLPLSQAIPAHTVYRKFFPGAGWTDFDTSTGDTVSSALQVGGVCPSPGSASYAAGLNTGDNCVQLMITDGGPNDTGGTADGVVTDPGGVANPDLTPPVLTLQGPNPQTVQFNSGGTYKDPGFTATDNVDGNITNQVVITGTISLGTQGDQMLVYNVKDAAGNPAPTQTRNVFVSVNAGGGNTKNRWGCAINPATAGPASRGDWWLLGGLLAWLGTLVRRRRRLG